MLSCTESLDDSALYTPREDACRLLQQRFADTALKHAIVEYVGLDTIAKIPFMVHTPTAILFRQIVTPNFEVGRFIDCAQSEGLQPVFFEYFDDIFTAHNFTKYAMGRLHIDEGVGKHGGKKIGHHTIIDFNASNGKLMRDVVTTTGESLVQFHHRLFLKKYPQYTDALFDASEALNDWGDKASTYYKKFLALCICFGVLHETLLIDDPVEGPFLKEIFLPAFEEVTKKFGVKPLIVHFLPVESAADNHWDFYKPEDFFLPDAV